MVAVRTRARCLSERERALLVAIAEAALPAGKILPAASTRTATEVEDLLARSGPTVALGYRALLTLVDTAARATTLRSLVALDVAARVRVLERFRTGGFAGRTSLRALLAPLKMVHYDDPRLFAALGCAYEAEKPAHVDTPRFLRERTTHADTLAPGEVIECDVVVVGTGAGGAVVAHELAVQGHAVVLVEEGDYHGRADFNGKAFEMQRKLYRDVGSTLALGNTVIPIPVGRAVGGTTTINAGTCLRAPDRVLDAWRDDLGLDDLGPTGLAPYYDRVEEVLGVAPADPRYLGGTASVIAKGCDALGYRHRPLRRNAPECDGKGVCCFGCPTDAKRSTNVSYVPMALKAGAVLLTGARVGRILVEQGQARGVVATSTRRPERRVTVRAKATVLACGALLTPVLLEASGLAGRSGELGRNLSIHPAQAVIAWFDEAIRGCDGIPQGYSIEEFHEEGLLFEGATAPLDMAAAMLPFVGPRFVDLVEAYDHSAAFGFLVEDTSRGSVHAGPGGRPIIRYVLNDHDVSRVKRGVEILCRVFLAAGARTVLPMVHGFDEIRGKDDLLRFAHSRLHARDLDLSAYHPLGTARMGHDPARSVVGPDHEVWGTPGLYVVDGSAIPSSIGVNPQLTIMALATRAGERIEARL